MPALNFFFKLRICLINSFVVTGVSKKPTNILIDVSLLITISNRYILPTHDIPDAKKPPIKSSDDQKASSGSPRTCGVLSRSGVSLRSSSGGGYHLRTCGMPPPPRLGPAVGGRPRRCQPAAGSRDRGAHDAGAGRPRAECRRFGWRKHAMRCFC